MWPCVTILLLQMNAAVCDEVVRLEDKVIQTKEERRFLLKHVFQQQAMSTMLGQMVAGKQPAVTMAASPIKGGSACIGSGGTRLASQSVAQLLGEAEKRSKKKAASTPTAGGSTSGKKKAAGVSREIHNGPGWFLFGQFDRYLEQCLQMFIPHKAVCSGKDTFPGTYALYIILVLDICMSMLFLKYEMLESHFRYFFVYL